MEIQPRTTRVMPLIPLSHHLPLLIVVALLFLTVGCTAQNSTGNRAIARIDELFAGVDSATPGYAIGIIREGKTILSKGYGSANLEHGIPIDRHTAFNVASLSKQFTAACIALLILDGKLSLDDPVKQFLPDFPEYPHTVRVKHLVYMTSGIGEYYRQARRNGTDWSGLHFFSVDTAIAAATRSGQLEFEPGTQWAYSNVNYMLLTRIVEAVSGMPFADFATQRIFYPLEMHHTQVNDDIFQVIPHRADGYNHRDAENTDWLVESGYIPAKGEGFLRVHRNSPHYGGSGIYTTLDDLLKWMDNFRTRKLGGDAFYELMHSTMRFKHDKANDAFGLVFGDFRGSGIVWYEGGDWGFSSYMMRFPGEEISVICLSNLGTGNARNFAHRVMDVLLEEGVLELK